ncbi:RHS repeat-associated core domain-containing protein [Streptomyces pseudovenezuelae]|uniref:RHS repeat-associated core domain-containing protein n=1 Tax=Streptomyces pseudovenezuelae TaxID=67350 RepID=UPI0036EF78C5
MHPRTGGHLELHDHWGSPTTTSPTARRYSGAYLDPTGLYKMGARYYDPHIGRFTQPGPSGQETNPYLYAAGDRVTRPIPRTSPASWALWEVPPSALSRAHCLTESSARSLAGLPAAAPEVR